ncbi:MAG: sugar phosphate isomerase/epimerase [Anaerolineales bacterium]|nr:sugar phosphate isomerase/epimerase [Anaerolineales bacterium]
MPPFRLGTTSYILPADILPNVRYLKDKVQDIELVLFEVDDGPNNLPGPAVIDELNALAAAHGLSYTVHLPLDLRLGAGGDEGHISLVKARRVIERTRALEPWAYVLHLDGKDLISPLPMGEGSGVRAISPLPMGEGLGVRAISPLPVGEGLGVRGPGVRAKWQANAVRALELAAEWAGDPALLAVENLEHYPPDFILPVLERAPVSRCVDIGHLWLDGHDPLPHLQDALPRTRVIHLHGVADRDHKSLAHLPPDKLDPVIALLLRENYAGVLTLEVFGEDDFHSSLAALQSSLHRVRLSEQRDAQ